MTILNMLFLGPIKSSFTFSLVVLVKEHSEKKIDFSYLFVGRKCFGWICWRHFVGRVLEFRYQLNCRLQTCCEKIWLCDCEKNRKVAFYDWCVINLQENSIADFFFSCKYSERWFVLRFVVAAAKSEWVSDNDKAKRKNQQLRTMNHIQQCWVKLATYVSA